MTGIWYCETDVELNEMIAEMEENPDFVFVGNFDTIQEVYEEMNYQGFTDEQIEELSQNQYGQCLEIYEYASDYVVYFGAR